MAIGNEVSRLIISLVGDASSYHRVLDAALAATEKFPDHIAAVSARVAAAIGPMFKQLETASVMAFSKFDLAATQSTSIMQVTDAQIKRIRDTALELSQSVSQSPETLARGFYDLAAAGMSAEQAIAALPAVTKFATAGNFDLSRAVELATTSQTAMGLRLEDPIKNMEQLSRVMNVVTKAGIAAEGSVSQMAEALANDAGAVAKQFNIPLEQTVATLVAFAKAGVRGAQGGHMFGRMIRLLDQGSQRKGDVQALFGFNFFDAAGNVRNMADVLADLDKIMKKLTPKGRGELMEMFGFKTLSQKALGPLQGMQDTIRKFDEDLKNVGDITGDVAGKQMAAFAEQMKRLNNIFTVAKIKMGEGLAPALRIIGDVLGAVGKAFNSMPPIVQKLTAAFISLVGIIAPTIIIIGALVPLWKSGVAALKFLAPALAFAKTALIAIGAAALAPVATFKALVVSVGSAAMSLISLAGTISLVNFAAFLAGAAWAGALAVAVYSLVQAQRELNRELERNKELQGQVTKRQQEQTDAILKQAEAKTDPAVRRDFLTKQLAMAEKELSGYQAGIVGAQQRVEDLGKSWITWMGFGAEPAKAELAALQTMLKAAQDRVEKLKTELGQVASPGGAKPEGMSPKTIGHINELTKKLAVQAATLNMTQAETDLYKLKLEGATDAALGNARGLARMVEEGEKLKKANDAVKDLNKSLQEQLQGFGLTGRQLEIFKLQMDGASAEQIKAAKSADAAISTLEEQAEAIKEAERLTEKYMPPQEKLAAEQEKLERLLDMGIITWETYTKALNDAANGANKTRDAISGIQGVAADSAEALARIDAFRDMDTTNPFAGGVGDAIDRPGRAFVGPLQETRDQADEMLAILEEIRDELAEDNDEPLTIVEGAFERF